MSADTAAKRYSAIHIGKPWRGLHVVPDVTIPQGERQAIMFMYSGILATGGFAYTYYGSPFLFTAANWKTGILVYAEAYFRATTGTVYTDLYDLTSAALVASSTLTTSAATFTRVRSAALTLTDGHEYRFRISKTGVDAGEILSAKLILLN